MRDTQSALRWITSTLHVHGVQFQITGGLAARLYGATRTLADVDISVTEDGFDKIIGEVHPYIIRETERYVDEHWDVKLMTLLYKGQIIELTAEEKIFDRNEHTWVPLSIDFQSSEQITIGNMVVPVIPMRRLISYKNKLRRGVDKRDIIEMQISNFKTYPLSAHQHLTGTNPPSL